MNPTLDTPSGTKVEYRGGIYTLVQGRDAGRSNWDSRWPKPGLPFPKDFATLAFILGYTDPLGYAPYWLVGLGNLQIVTEEEKDMSSSKESVKPIMFVLHCSKDFEDLQKAFFQLGAKWGAACSACVITKASTFPVGLCLNEKNILSWHSCPTPKVYGDYCTVGVHCVTLPAPPPLKIAGHLVKDLSKSTATVGCTNVSYEDICKLKEAMEKAE